MRRLEPLRQFRSCQVPEVTSWWERLGWTAKTQASAGRSHRAYSSAFAGWLIRVETSLRRAELSGLGRRGLLLSGRLFSGLLFSGHLFGSRIVRAPFDVLTTLTYFTAFSIAESLRRFATCNVRELIVSGGGAHNRTLMSHLSELLAPIPVRSIARYGIPPQAKEPVAFAYFALCAIRNRVNHLPETTGARTPCILGAVTPASPKALKP